MSRCRCEDLQLCYRYPGAKAACKAAWDVILGPFAIKGREWSIAELRELWPYVIAGITDRIQKGRSERTLREDTADDLQVFLDLIKYSCEPHPRPPKAGKQTLASHRFEPRAPARAVCRKAAVTCVSLAFPTPYCCSGPSWCKRRYELTRGGS